MDGSRVRVRFAYHRGAMGTRGAGAAIKAPTSSPAAARWARGCARSTGRRPRSVRSRAWPQSLRSAVSILLPSKAQIVLFWGTDLVTLYNDAYRPVFGAKHPDVLGPARPRGLERDLGDRPPRPLRGRAHHRRGVLGERPPVLHRAVRVSRRRRSSTSPTIRCATRAATVGGVFCIVSETTGRVVGERRLKTLRELGSRTTDGREVGRGGVPERRRGHRRREPPRPAVRASSTCSTPTSGTARAGRSRAGLAEGSLAAQPVVDRSCRDRGRAPWPLRRVPGDGRGRGGDRPGAAARAAAGRRVAGAAAHAPSSCRSSKSGQDRSPASWSPGVSPRRAARRRSTAVSSTCWRARSPPRSPTRAPTRRSGAAPRRSPSSTARRPRSSAT